MPKLPGIEYSSQVGGSLGREDVNAPIRAARARGQAAEALGQVAEQYVEYKGATEYNNAMLDYEPALAEIEAGALDMRQAGVDPTEIGLWQDKEMEAARQASADTIKTGRGHRKFNATTEQLDMKTKIAWGRQQANWIDEDFTTSSMASLEHAIANGNWGQAKINFEELSTRLTPKALANYAMQINQGAQIDEGKTLADAAVDSGNMENLTQAYEITRQITDPQVRGAVESYLTKQLADSEADKTAVLIDQFWETGEKEEGLQAAYTLREDLRDQVNFKESGMTENQFEKVWGEVNKVIRRYEGEYARELAGSARRKKITDAKPFGHNSALIDRQAEEMMTELTGDARLSATLAQEGGVENAKGIVDILGKIPATIFGQTEALMFDKNTPPDVKTKATMLAVQLYNENPNMFNVGGHDNKKVKYLKELARYTIATKDAELAAQHLNAPKTPESLDAARSVIMSGDFTEGTEEADIEDVMEPWGSRLIMDPTVSKEVQDAVRLVAEKNLWRFVAEGKSNEDVVAQALQYASTQVTDTLGEDQSSGTKRLTLNAPSKIVQSDDGLAVVPGEWEHDQAVGVWEGSNMDTSEIKAVFTGAYLKGKPLFNSVIEVDGIKKFKTFTYDFDSSKEAAKQRKERDQLDKKAKEDAAFEMKVAAAKVNGVDYAKDKDAFVIQAVARNRAAEEKRQDAELAREKNWRKRLARTK